MGRRVLLAYGSRAGSTAEVAAAIARILEEKGLEVDVLPVKKVRSLTGYDAVVVGTACRVGHVLPEVTKFVERNRAALAQVPVAYFTVSLTMTKGTSEALEEAAGYLAAMQSIKEPVSIGLFAGKIDFSKLSPVWRFFFTHNKELDIHEGDWRDWEAIAQWAEDLAPKLELV